MVRRYIAALVAAFFTVSASNVHAYENTLEMVADVVGGGESWLRYRAFVSGIYEGHMISARLYKRDQLTCPSPETTRQELAEAVLPYLATISDEDDERLTMPARTIVFTGLIEAYRCK